MAIQAAVVTVSDGCYHGQREDLSGDALCERLAEHGWSLVARSIVPDDVHQISAQIVELSDQDLDLIVTTGGTGLGPRDVTPEAIRPLLDREAEGLAELMRLRGLEKTDFAALSRSLAGTRNETLILALPGSPKGATESLDAVVKLLPHAIDLIHGQTKH